MKEFDEIRLRKKLLSIYKSFVNNPENKKILDLARRFHLKYEGLSTLDEHLVKPIVSKNILRALDGLSTIYQYGMWEKEHEAFSNEKILKKARKILEDLKEQ